MIGILEDDSLSESIIAKLMEIFKNNAYGELLWISAIMDECIHIAR